MPKFKSPAEELEAAKDKFTQDDIDKAVQDRLLYKLRKATHYMPDGKKAQTPSIIGKTLSDVQLMQLWASLSLAKKKGKPVYDQLAWKIQNDWGLLKEVSSWHVSRAIAFYEQRIFGLLGVVESDPELGEWTKGKREAIDKIIERVDGMETLSNAITIQMNRIQMAHERELSAKVPFGFVQKDMKALALLIDRYLHYQIELGVSPRQPIKADITLRQGFDAQVRKIDSTIGRDPMKQAGKRFIEMLQTTKDEPFKMTEFED